MTAPLAGKAALITGASSGIGQATALALAAAGAAVAVSGRRTERLEELVGKVEADGGIGFAFAGDISDEPTATRFVNESGERLGRVDILVNAAGIQQVASVENANLDDWRRVLDINLMAALYTCRAAIPALKVQGGDIVNISSTAGRRSAGPTFNAYSTSKFGLTALTEGLRQEVGKYGIRVCIVEPGATRTEVAEGIRDATVRDMIRNHVSKDGVMLPEDIAAAILFAVTRPPHVNLTQLLIQPTHDTRAM